jgi:hypothetical protein
LNRLPMISTTMISAVATENNDSLQGDLPELRDCCAGPACRNAQASAVRADMATWCEADTGRQATALVRSDAPRTSARRCTEAAARTRPGAAQPERTALAMVESLRVPTVGCCAARRQLLVKSNREATCRPRQMCGAHQTFEQDQARDGIRTGTEGPEIVSRTAAPGR